ncbi:MAG TPA: YcgN family cysteine cluster protein [Alcanivorax sp.]|nr:YcgN family cysteine cluster protein [Alcanivorax sp.]
MRERFWELPLEQLDAREWEALCDGCGRCCLVKLEDEDSGEVAFTDVACGYLDTEQCRCGVYPERHRYVPDCVEVTAEVARHFDWLPATCAYRLRARGRSLQAWHPLLSGRPESVREAGVSVAGRVVSETTVDEADLEAHIVHWVN